MTCHTIANLFVSASVALIVLIILTAAVNARTSLPAPVSASTSANSHDFVVSRVITTVPFPLGIGSYPTAIGVNPNSGLAYVANFIGKSVTVLSGIQAIAELPVGGMPHKIEVNTASGYVYVLLSSLKPENRVVILKGTKVITTVTVGEAPESVKANPLTGYVYVANAGSGDVTILSGTNVLTTVAVGGSPLEIAINPVTNRAYVTNLHDGSLSILSGASIITHVWPGVPVLFIDVNPLTGYVYATSPDSNAVSILSDTPVLTTITGIPAPGHLGINSASGYIYVVNDSANSVTVLSGTQVVTTVAVTGVEWLSEVAANPNTGFIYVTSPADRITVLSGAQVITALAATGLPTAVGVNPQSGHVYVARPVADAVTVLSGAVPIATVKPKAQPVAIGVNAINGLTYVSSAGSRELTVMTGTQVITSLELNPHFPIGYQAGFGYPVTFETDPTSGYLYAGDRYNLAWVSGTQIISPPDGLFRSAEAVRANPATGLVYIANEYSMTVMSGSQVITSFAMPYVNRITVNPATGYVYVAQYGDPDMGGMPNTITIISYTDVITSITFCNSLGYCDYSGWGDIEINPATGLVYASNGAILSGTAVLTTTGVAGYHVGVNRATGLVYVSNEEILSTGQHLSSITVISGLQVIARLPVGLPDSAVSGIVVNPTSGHIYVAQTCCYWQSLDVTTGTLTVISGTQVVDVLPAGQNPRSIIMNTLNGLAYVANSEGSVSVIASQISPRSLTPGALFTSGDNIVLDFGRPVITTSLRFEMSPTLPFTVTWSPAADLVTISHAPLAISARYTLHVLPGGQAVSGLGVAEWKFIYAYYPFHFFLPLIEK